jgi:hypothetical protein
MSSGFDRLITHLGPRRPFGALVVPLSAAHERPMPTSLLDGLVKAEAE